LSQARIDRPLDYAESTTKGVLDAKKGVSDVQWKFKPSGRLAEPGFPKELEGITMTTICERLNALQITLPDVQPPVVDGYVAAFVPFVRTGNLIYLSGRLAKKDGKLWSGKVGEQITTLEGKQAARGIAIELLATLQAALGDLDKIKRIVKVVVMVNSTPNFTESHEVANGASELFLEVFGERGTHARTSHGGAEIPFGACVEIELIAEIIDPADECFDCRNGI
jgi:enamine deaminase RidA (YjgF/YER057c/UK114 family)